MGLLEVEEEVGQGAWWCLASVGTPCPSGRSQWTSGTVRGQKRGGGCCRPGALPPSGRIRQQRAPTVSRSTSPKPRLDSEHRAEVFPSHLLTHPHPLQSWPISVCLRAQFWIRTLLMCYSPLAFPSKSVIILIKQAMTAIVVSWNLDILQTQRPKRGMVAS